MPRLAGPRARAAAGFPAFARWTALLTCIAFGCATVHEPVPRPAPPPRVALAEPELELWMEGTRPVDPDESQQTLWKSREALSQALAGRGLHDPDPEQILLVRARAIARTGERKTAQVLSAVGIVVVVVGIVVLAIVATHHKGSPSGGRGAPHRAVAAPPLRSGPTAHAFHPRPYPPPPPFGVNLGLAVVVDTYPELPPPWITPVDAWLESRGWFDGDAVELTASLGDPKTGAITWQRTVRDAIDPRDPAALSRLVDRALEGLPFGQKEPNPVESPTVTD